jgi:hypothetical protein
MHKFCQNCKRILTIKEMSGVICDGCKKQVQELKKKYETEDKEEVWLG